MSSSIQRIELDQEPIWEIQFDETAAQYRAFCLYRDLLDGRSVVKVAAVMARERGLEAGWEGAGKAPKDPSGRLNRLSARNRWVERADAYELHIDQQRRQERETKIARMERREEQLGTVGVSGVMRRVLGYEDPDDPSKSVEAMDWGKLTPGEVAQLARTFVEISRLSTNRPTSLARSTLAITPRDYEAAMNGVIEIAMKHIPDDRKTSFAEEVNAFLHDGER